jgi:hypothetical protein
MPEGQVGTFTVTISSEQLKRGLRFSKRSPRNAGYLVTCIGAVGRDGVLQVLDTLTRVDTSAVTGVAFPYPQLFVGPNLILICTSTKIYEYSAGVLTLKYTAAVAAGTWSVADFYDYLYFSNGNIAVIRDGASKVYSLSTLPFASAICNFNGQVIIGAPNVAGLVT